MVLPLAVTGDGPHSLAERNLKRGVSLGLPSGQAIARAMRVPENQIISVDNKPAISALETMDQVAEIRPGSVIPVVVMRDDKQLTLQVTIQEYPATN